MKIDTRAPLALALFAFCGVAFASGQLSIREAWIRTPPPGARMLAGYAVLHNAGQQIIAVTGAVGADFAGVSLHENSESNGVERMRALERVEVAPQRDVTLKPGGIHLMLMQPQRELKAGDHVSLRMRTEDGQEAAADFVVRDDAP